ncbi:peroxidase-like [Pecten maximus]|uniref:peroxidase-like n=1 Tax=Pecten maximus TaxID=6579 RepID=UPI00145812FC|nr:peroxidase-like [Pecten maximus]
MVFQVQTCGTARLALKEDDEDDGPLWEISFESGSTDLEVQIRRSVGRGIRSRGNIPVTDCSASLTILVSWRNNFIQVLHQEQGRWLSVINWFDDLGRDVSYVGVSGDASWEFYDDHEIGIDLEPGDTTSETMAGLNDIEPNLTELEIEERRANLALYALKYLIENGPIKTVDGLKGIPGFSEAFEQAQIDADRNACNEERIRCIDFRNSPFRTIDGTCNNLINPALGSPGTSQRRLVGAMYADGVSAFKENGENDQKLPTAREVSAFGMSDGSGEEPADDPNRTIMMAVMGQFYDHDITETPMVKGHKEATIGCCSITDALVRNKRMQCKIIEIDPLTDPAFSHTCMAFRRSIPTRTTRGGSLCEPNVREQVNDITSYVDGSMVYGSTEEVAHQLRTFEDGKLLVADNDLLPENDPSGCILNDPDNTHCFLAGDIRSNENPNLMVIHTAFVRYHNLLCDKLIEKGVTGDDLIYNIARKIIGGILQNILYGHWLPHVIGDTMMNQTGLAVGSPFTYDETLDPSIILEFSTAAFRYGHTLVQGVIKRMGSCFTSRSETDLKDTFFNPELVFSSVDDIARSFHTTHCSAVDSELPDDLKDHLFETETALPSDLSALNIQRGRDHGLPGYTAYRVWARLSEPADFSGLTDHTTHFQQQLQAVYSNVKDIDLFAGGMTETVDPVTHLGPTFTAIIAEQFRRLKFGDRHFFENTDVTGFTLEQIEAIKEVTLGKIMCQVFQFISIQNDVFAFPGIEDLKSCDDYPELDIDLFINIGE